MHVIITGASRGLGRALSHAFSELPDMHLYLISRSGNLLESLSKECKQINPQTRISLLPFDISLLRGKEIMLPASLEHVDILVNNAGYLVNKPFESLSEDDMQKMIDTNLLSPARLIRQLLGKLGGDRPSHVVNIGSMGGFQGSVKFPGLSMYSASKAALASLTECLATEFADRQIFFNCLAIGAVQTEMLESAFPGYKAPLDAEQMSEFIMDFCCNGFRYMNGKILPVSVSTP